MILLNKINKLCMYVNKTIPNKVCALFVLPLYYPRCSCDSFDAAIYLTSQSMHHLLTTQVFVRFLNYVTKNTAVSSSSITKSHLVISWPARKLVPSLSFLRCV